MTLTPDRPARVTITLRINPELVGRVDRYCKKLEISRESWLRQAVKEKLENDNTKQPQMVTLTRQGG